MLEITNLSVTYGSGPGAVRALGPFSLSLARGEICSVVGPSGAGKSTLLHALCGIVPRHGGSVLLGGEPVDPARRTIGFIPQDYGLLPWRTVRQNCLLPFLVKGRSPGGGAEARLDRLAGRLGIAGLMGRYPGELSGGQRQRAAVARAFLVEPELLLLDEPFSALDALTREQAQDLFLELWRESPVTAVFVTHSVEEAVAIGRRVLILSRGPGTALEVVDNPRSGSEGFRASAEFHALADRIRSSVIRAWGTA